MKLKTDEEREKEAKEKEENNTEEKEEKKKTGCNNQEIVAVLGHELGHWKMNHVLKNILIAQVGRLFSLTNYLKYFKIFQVQIFSLFALFGYLSKSSPLYQVGPPPNPTRTISEIVWNVDYSYCEIKREILKKRERNRDKDGKEEKG